MAKAGCEFETAGAAADDYNARYWRIIPIQCSLPSFDTLVIMARSRPRKTRAGQRQAIEHYR